MDKYVPLSKKSKKEQKKFHAMQRKTWNGLNPVTRTVPNGKAYDRKGLIYGVGHAVYTISDPRAVLLKQFVETLAEKKDAKRAY